jgi:uncharacterized protein
MMKIQWLNSVEEIPADLWQKTFPPDREGRWWYSVMERSKLEDQFEFLYGLLLENDEPIGIVPAFVNNVPIELVAPDAIAAALRVMSKFIPACGYQRTLFIGSPCADEGTIGLVPEITLSHVVKPIHQAVLERAKELKAPMIVWKDFPQLTQLALDTLCENSPVFKIPSYPGTILHFKEASLQSYLKGLKSSHRSKLLKKLKRSKEQFSFDTAVIQNPDKQTLNEIFALFWQTYERGKTKFERLNKEFFSLIAQEKESYFVILRHPDQGNIVAFMLCFLVGNKVINKFIGLDYNIARESSLYFRLWEAAIEWTTSRGIKIFQSGQTGYSFKLETGNTLEPLFNYCQNRNPLINTIFAQVARTISWASLDEDLAIYLKAHGAEQDKSK